ncbi:radical SAM protein [Catenibacillus scindens]|uniref:B12-binding domain-containing radical SAM protein n=1 Tax=Catenibacillus scindens TaxID=673271 RepID=UPI003207E8A7
MESVIYIVKSNCDNRELARNNYMPPLGLLSIASMLQLHGYHVEVIDLSIKNYRTEDINQIIERIQPLLIGFSVYTENVDATFNMCKYFKRRYPKIPIVFGGPHPTLDPEYCMRKRYVDFISRGDGEQSSLELLEAIRTHQKLIRFQDIHGLIYLDENKQYQYGEERRNLEDLDLLPIINRDFIPESYQALTPTVYSSRGCPGRCIYCAAPSMSGGKYRIRDIENVFLETLLVTERCGVPREIFYIDDTFTVFRNRVERFVELCENSKIKIIWRCESRVDALVKNSDLLEGMKRAGCKRIQFGIESGNQQVLDQIRKHMSLLDAKEIIDKTIRCGIPVAASFMFGHYCDTVATMTDTLNLMEELKKQYGSMIDVVYGLNTPFPGTYQYDHMEELGMTFTVSSYSQLDMYGPVIKTKNFDAKIQLDFYGKAGKLMASNRLEAK